MSADVDRDWLEWARQIVRIPVDCPVHFQWCERRLERAVARYTDLDQDLRWPGYVGRRWELGRGVLFIGSVHADFRGSRRDADYESRTPIVRALGKANVDWRDRESPTHEDDDAYLDATRTAYTSLMPHWKRAQTFSAFVGRLFGDQQNPFDHAAWTNLAHCRSMPEAVPERNLQLRCSSEIRDFPISDLIRRLWPAVVLVSVLGTSTSDAGRYDLTAERYAHLRPAGYEGPILRIFPGRGTEMWNGKHPRDWLPELEEEVLSRWRSLR